MRWEQVRISYPDQWLVIEALEAYSDDTHRRHVERLAVLEQCSDGDIALKRYRHLHQEFPQREFYFVHTSRKELNIQERQWVGIRRGNEVNTT